ncbi:7552_t:CDS:2, partial [Gigaspora rosea]
MVSQDKSCLLSNTSTQETDNDQNNNKEHVPEISLEISGSSQHRTSSSVALRSMRVHAITVQVIEDQISTTENRESPPVKQWSNVKNDIVAAKQHFRKGSRSHLEIVFTDQEKLKKYATKGVKILNKSYYRYIPTDSRNSFLLFAFGKYAVRASLQISSNLIQALPSDIIQNVWSKTVNTNAINQKEVIVIVDDVIETPTPSNGSNLPNLDEDLCNELTMDNPFSSYFYEKPFLTFFQNVQNNQIVATCLNYVFIDKNHGHLISETEMLFGNSDYLLVKCTLKLENEAKKSLSWRFDKNLLKNELLRSEIIKEINSVRAAEDWDCLKRDKMPASHLTDQEDEALSYNIQKYIKKEIDLEVTNSITRNLSTVSELEIKQDEVVAVIRSLPNKSPGLDGLTYEFYKLLEDDITPVLTVIFNQVLEKG